MTKQKSDKRRIEIEDKRARGEGNGEDAAVPDTSGDGGSPTQVAAEEQLRQFTDAAATERPTRGTPGGTGEALTAEEQAAQYLELAQRREAEFRNYRRRVQKDVEDARRFAVEALLADLFPALDGLAQAAATFKDTPDGDNALLDGVRRTVKSLDSAMLKHGIEKIGDAPVPFDGELHQALSVEDSAEVAEPTVVEVFVEGYRLGSTVLKPAMVRVVKPAAGGEADGQ